MVIQPKAAPEGRTAVHIPAGRESPKRPRPGMCGGRVGDLAKELCAKPRVSPGGVGFNDAVKSRVDPAFWRRGCPENQVILGIPGEYWSVSILRNSEGGSDLTWSRKAALKGSWVRDSWFRARFAGSELYQSSVASDFFDGSNSKVPGADGFVVGPCSKWRDDVAAVADSWRFVVPVLPRRLRILKSADRKLGTSILKPSACNSWTIFACDTPAARAASTSSITSRKRAVSLRSLSLVASALSLFDSSGFAMPDIEAFLLRICNISSINKIIVRM